MAYSIPNSSLPVVSTLGIRWPDINEDDVSELGGDFLAFGSAIQDVGETVAHTIGDLCRSSSGRALDQLGAHWGSIRREYLDPVSECFSTAKRACDDGFNVIHIYKGGLLAYLDLEVGVPVDRAVGQAAADRTVERMSSGAEGQLATLFAKRLTVDVDQEIDGIVRKAGNLVDPAVYGALSGDGSVLSLPTSEGRFSVSTESLAAAARTINESLHRIERAARQLTSAYSDKTLTQHTDAPSDAKLRRLIEGVLDSVIPGVVAAVRNLCIELIDHAAGLVNLIAERVQQTDRTLAATGRGLAGLGLSSPAVARLRALG